MRAYRIRKNPLRRAYMVQSKPCHKGPGTILFLVDRVALARQTSEEFRKFGIPHGMVQGEYTHGRHMDVQICSMQSLEKRGFFPGRNIRLVVYDEAHELRKEIIKFILNWGGPTIGLTATPFREGLGKIYQACVDLITTDQLVAEKWLAEMRVIAGVQPNMKGCGYQKRWRVDGHSRHGARSGYHWRHSFDMDGANAEAFWRTRQDHRVFGVGSART